jgi:hypothetical protein
MRVAFSLTGNRMLKNRCCPWFDKLTMRAKPLKTRDLILVTQTAKPPALLERLTAVQHKREWLRRISEGNRYSHKEILMTQQHHLNHATWDCKYHVVFVPKYRKKAVFGKIKKNLGAVFHDLARRRECRIEEGHLMPEHAPLWRTRNEINVWRVQEGVGVTME